MNQDEVLSILTPLISFATTNDNVGEIHQCYEWIDQQLDFFPFNKHVITHNGVESRIWSTENGKNADYILSAHIDVVPGSKTLFALRHEGSKVIGRGVSDMKYAVALYILVLKKLFNQHKKLPSVAIVLTSDEERGGINGTGHIVKDLGFRAKAAFVPDGGENDHIVEDAKGVLHLKVTAQGKPAHAARLWEGKSANDTLLNALFTLRQTFPFPETSDWRTTINIGQIRGGLQTNQVADLAEAQLDVRFVPEETPDAVVRKIRQICQNCAIDVLVQADAFHINRQDLYIQHWNKLLANNKKESFVKENSASDGRYFTSVGIPTIVSKPVGGLIHTEKEWSNLPSICHFGDCLFDFLRVEL